MYNYFESILSVVPGHLYWKDANGKYLGCNNEQAKNLGFSSPSEIIGLSDYDLSPKAIADKIRDIDNEVIRNGNNIVSEEEIILSTGEKAIVLSKKSPLKDNKNKTIGIIGVSFDITAEKLNEQYKHEKEKAEEKAHLMQFYETILDLIPGHVYWIDNDGYILGCNKQQALTAGFQNKEDMIGKTNFDMPWASQAEYLNANNRKVIESGKLQTLEEPFEIKGKQAGIFLTKKQPLRNEKNEVIGLLGVSFDITTEKENQRLLLEKLELEKKQAEEKAKLMAFYETILDLIPGHVYWKDKEGILQGCNIQQARTIGLKSKDEAIGRSAIEMITTNLSPEEKQHEADLISKSDKKVMESDKEVQIEEPLKMPDGSLIHFLSTKKPLYDDEGNVNGLLGVSIDITAEKENQRLQMEKLQLEKEEAERKAELMQILAGSMAHELRTPLGALSSYAQGINMHLPKLLEVYNIAKEANLELPFIGKQQLDAMSKSAESIQTEVRSGFHFIDMLLKNIQQDLRGYSFEETSLKQCIEVALERYPIQASQQHIVKTDLQKDIRFNGNEDLMVHVLFNLLKNALFYVGTAVDSEIFIHIPAGKENKLIFRDNGAGIKPDVLPHIFEKFYSKSHHGTGVGLAFCQMVIENFKGSITCHSELSKYTEFVITFP